MRDNKSGWAGFSDSYRTKAHDQILELKNPRLEPERCDLSAEGVPPLRDPSSGQFARPYIFPVQSVGDALSSGPLAYPKLTVQRRRGWHHMPLGVRIVYAGLLINNQFAHQWRDKNTKKLTRLSGIDRRRGCRRTCGMGFG